MLVQAVETCSGGALIAHPYPERKQDPAKDSALHCIYYIGLGPAPPPTTGGPAPRGTLNLNPAVEQFQARSILHWSPYDPVRVVNADP
jgi:hypothetical protein